MRKMLFRTLPVFLIALAGVTFLAFAPSNDVSKFTTNRPSTNIILGGSPLEQGVSLFKYQQYEAALEQLQKAADENPNDPLTNLWLGLVLEANKQPFAAMEAWRKCYGNPQWEQTANYLKGLSWWNMGRIVDATNYLKDAQTKVTAGRVRNFKPAKEALAQIETGATAPHFSEWASLAGIPASYAELKNTSAKKPAVVIKQREENKQPEIVKNTPPKTESVPAGTRPVAGKWKAVISNGYKGDVLTFRVSADGNTITDVEFKGHWRNSGSVSGLRTEVLTNLDPPDPFIVTKGNFSAVQRVPKSRMWWEFTGHFSSATSAEGTYRAAYAGGQNDTYKLKWTAKRVGP